MHYYNEHDKRAAAWLRELIRANLIPNGEVDERSIKDVRPNDLSRYVSCHFFAGIGGWPYALRLAGWPDERPVWTGSCPCQPFSAAGKGLGESDLRHLWPDFRGLIAKCGPSTTFGEQVASRDGRDWLARVRADMEALGHAFGAADLCAACVGAPHIRQRLFWVGTRNGLANAESRRRYRSPTAAEPHGRYGLEGSGTASGLAYTNGRLTGNGELQPGREHGFEPEDCEPCRVEHPASGCSPSGLVNSDMPERREQRGTVTVQSELAPVECPSTFSGWNAYDLIHCTDGKSRRVEPGTLPLAHGVPGRVGMLRGYGNAIVPQVAAMFVRAFLEVECGQG